MIGREVRLTLRFYVGVLVILGVTFGARANIVTDWNQTANRATEIGGAPIPVQTRVMAIVHAAIFDAVSAVDRKYASYAIDLGPATGRSAEAAAATVAHGILERLYPPQRAIADAALVSYWYYNS